MIIASDIMHKPCVKRVFPKLKAPDYIKQQSFCKDSEALNFTPDFVKLIKKFLYALKKSPILNPEIEPGKFFGLESYEMICRKKTEALFTYLKNFEFGCGLFNVECSQRYSNDNIKNLADLFKNLKSDFGCTKITFNEECFKGSFHTIGFVRDKGVLYILDSLGHNKNADSGILNFHHRLKNILSAHKKNTKLEKIIFNTKTQQSVDELTCNHWAYANIEALISSLKNGKIIKTNEALDSVLPSDINKVLKEHKNFVLSRHSIYNSN